MIYFMFVRVSEKMHSQKNICPRDSGRNAFSHKSNEYFLDNTFCVADNVNIYVTSDEIEKASKALSHS